MSDVRRQFERICTNACAKVKENYNGYIEPSKQLSKGYKGRGGKPGYYTEHYWQRVDLVCSDKKKEFEAVSAILIKPYRITLQDVKTAENSKIGKLQCGNFEEYHKCINIKRCVKNQQCKQCDSIVDYDKDTGNFHKKMRNIKKMEFQIILVKKGGPGWGTEEERKQYDKDKNWIEKDGRYVKTDWYFPPIINEPVKKEETNEEDKKLTPEEKMTKELIVLLESAIKAVYDIKETEQK